MQAHIDFLHDSTQEIPKNHPQRLAFERSFCDQHELSPLKSAVLAAVTDAQAPAGYIFLRLTITRDNPPNDEKFQVHWGFPDPLPPVLTSSQILESFKVGDWPTKWWVQASVIPTRIMRDAAIALYREFNTTAITLQWV